MKCSAKDCGQPAVAEVILYDVYQSGQVFFERDFTCPYLCTEHLRENEESIGSQERRPRGVIEYRFSNQHRAHGFTIYRPITPV
jgi:hypothetical protein